MAEVTYSVVVPVYNEADSLPALVGDLAWLMDQLDGPCEVLIVDDGSGDDSYRVAREAQERDPRFRALQLSRNFGHQMALTAGLARARGEAVVTMDGDGQHPVSTVLEMVARWREGFDVVYGVMTDRPSESAFKRTTANAFYRVLGRLSDTPAPRNAGDFRLMSREVVDALMRMTERNRYLRGMVSWLGFTQVGVPFACGVRHGGASSYTLRKMIDFAGDGLLSFSVWPLRVSLKAGFAVSVFSVFFGLLTIVMRLTSRTVPGWATIVVVTSFLGGVQLVVLGVVGEYVGRIYEEVKNRPLYVVREETGPSAVAPPRAAWSVGRERTPVEDWGPVVR